MDKRKTDEDENSSCNILKRAKFSDEEETQLKEKVIKYYVMSSLEHLAAAKIVITLWSRTSVLNKIKKLCRERSVDCLKCMETYGSSNLNESGHGIKEGILNTVLEISEFEIVRKILSGLVDPLGQEIFDWIEYQDRIGLSKSSWQLKAVNYLDCLVWTSRGTIDYKETAKKLLVKISPFCERDRYSLACTYCLEEEAAIILPNLTRRPFFSMPQVKYGDKPMEVFLTAHLVGNLANLTKEVCGYNKKYRTEYSINEYIFRELVNNKKHRNNQEAIKFMWNKLCDEEKSRQILSVIKYSRTDLKCFFLSQMNEAQQLHAFQAESRRMLSCLLDDWLWKDYFLPTLHHVWNVIPALDFLRVVEDIVERRMEKHYEDVEPYNRYKIILKEMWLSAPKRLKEFIFEYQNGCRSSGIIFGLLCARNVDLIQIILPDISDAQKQVLIFSTRRNYHKCYWLIINEQTDVVERFIDETIFAENDVEVFKQKLVESYGCDIAVYFVQNRKKDQLDRFLRWVFKSDNDKREFMAKLIHSKICGGILEHIVAENNERSFKELENFIQWCASRSTEKVFELKREMYNICFTKVFCKLIEKDDYQLLDKFLNWCFPNDEQEVELMKHCFYSYNAYYQVVYLVLKLVEKNDQMESLEKFVRWCFTEKRELAIFKEWILEPSRGGTIGVCVMLLCKGMFKLAAEFVHWCCDPFHIKIRMFKNKLLLCDTIEYLFIWNRRDEKKLKKVLKWFNPTPEILIQFKKKFEDFGWLDDCDIAAHFIRNQKWKEMDQFLQLNFETDLEKKVFKKNLAYSKVRDEILELVVANSDAGGFTELDNFLRWCASGNGAKVSEMKSECEHHFKEAIFCQLIIEDKYRLIEQFLNWLYPHDERQIETIKRLYGYRNRNRKLVLSLVEKNDQFQSLEKFLRWCFVENIEVASFKESILKPDTDDVCTTLLRKGMFELADEFVRWCCDSSEVKITKFKNQLMVFSGIKCVFKRFERDDKMAKLIKWFNPSKETKIQFRKKFKKLCMRLEHSRLLKDERPLEDYRRLLENNRRQLEGDIMPLEDHTAWLEHYSSLVEDCRLPFEDYAFPLEDYGIPFEDERMLLEDDTN